MRKHEDPAAQERRQNAQSEMMSAAHNAVHRVALMLEDPAHVANAPIFVGAKTTEPTVRPLTRLEAAVWLRGRADQQVHSAITKARGAGATWAEIGKVLDLPEQRGDYDLAVAAFEYALGYSFSDQNVYYDCGACGQGIKDHGPYDPHPEDQESGHAETCERLRAAVAAYKRRMGDDY
ncbi:hypothetical protein [Micromonospora aurantiaca (nom. illeg.)]|uniref:hypothetical protein n=1 Tax=Micromonospora aurantiaca (nom. illeg.) TaxID=47850 RepID=UPI0011A026B7|nr:hypothetical protein [Micromonospora aurantiaca]MBC9000477.1 hypothetical protein [Micromonospora aurantiaca]